MGFVLLAALYGVLEEKLKAVYEECVTLRGRIGTNEITGHEVLAEGVYRTEYAGGSTVYVNYNLYDVELPDGSVLPAEDYLIKEGK